MLLQNTGNIVQLSIPADENFSVIVRTVLCSTGSIFGFCMDEMTDVGVASDEALICLQNQPIMAKSINVNINCLKIGVSIIFESVRSENEQAREKSNVDITRAILETLVPSVEISDDGLGINKIKFFFPAI